MSKAHTGKKQTPESIAKTKAAITGKKQSPEHTAKLAKVRKGKHPIAATNAAADYWRGRKQTPEHIEKRMVAHIGVPKPKLRKLQPDDVREIRAAQGKESQRSLAKRFGVGSTTIHDIQHRLNYSDIPD